MASLSDGVVDAQQESEASQATEEQPKPSYEDQLMEVARQERAVLDDPKPPQAISDETVEEPEPEPEPEPLVLEKEAEPAEEKVEEEKAEPEDKLDKRVPLREVIEERNAKKRERAEKERVQAELDAAKAQLAKFQQTAQKAHGPLPTEDNPLADIMDPQSLKDLQKEYQAILKINRKKTNEEGLIPVMTGRGANGRPVYQAFTPDDVEEMQRKAEIALRVDFPEREKYLAQRVQFDNQAVAYYPDFVKPESQFAQEATFLAQEILSGRAAKSPDLMVWIGHAIEGYHQTTERLRNGNGKAVKAPVEALVESAKTKIAPTASKTRSLVQRRQVTDQRQALKNLETKPTEENAVAFVDSVLRQSGKKSLAPIAE